MLILSGKSLGERQKELNAKVTEAVTNNVDFEQVKNETEQSDVDKLFKIDLASKYKNIEYIVEVLKSGDSLHISRALKCAWMFEDEYSHVINVDYLHHNVFPFMSTKMKKKLLTTASRIFVRNVDRAVAFCNYCMGMKLTNIALHFLIFTSEDYKLDFMSKHPNLISELRYKNNLNHFIGSSFTLADAYLSTLDGEAFKLKALKEMNYLYSASNDKYLGILEKQVPVCRVGNMPRLGLRISKDIITKHKHRVLNNPSLYISFLNKSVIIKHSTAENAKIYVTALLPDDVNNFWSGNFCSSYEYILNKITSEEVFEFIKKIFNDKYPGEPFEMVLKFYSLKYYRFMTREQKEKWALDQIASQKELLGIGNDYKWYVFVSFETAFDAIKKLVMITRDNDKRSKMINVLIESAKTQRELEKLFKHYYERHNNEIQHFKEDFVKLVAFHHNIFDFERDCWDAFNKIYQNLDVYSTSNAHRTKNEFKIIAFIYCVINNLDVHDALKSYINECLSFYTLKENTNKLTEEKQEMVYQYLFKFYMDKIREFDSVPYENEGKYALRKYIYNILDLLSKYGRTRKDIPEVVMKLIKLDWEEFKFHHLVKDQTKADKVSKRTTQADLLRLLKKDANLLIEHLPLVKETIEYSHKFHLGLLLKKLNVFFSNDISKEYIKFYNELLTESKLKSNVARAACYGIFQLGENSLKEDFMSKHAPTQSKVNRGEIDETLLNIQEAICATAFYSRPPVPLKNMLMYVKGDYVQYCVPMFNHYLANLPLPLCIEFIETILNNPLSIQKHGLRLAFTCFDTDNLNKLVLHVWKRTKNVSLRLVIYNALYDKIRAGDQNTQTKLFETLKTFTSELNQDDDQKIFELLTSGKLPRRFISDYTDTAWTTVNAFADNNLNIERKTSIIKYMSCNIQYMHQEMIRSIVETFVDHEFSSEEALIASIQSTNLEQSKWALTTNYVTYILDEEDFKQKLELTKLIFNQCLRKYNLVQGNRYIVREFCVLLLRKLLQLSFSQTLDTFKWLNVIFDNIIDLFYASLPVKDFYNRIWWIRLNIAARNALADINSINSDNTADEKNARIKDKFINFGKNIGLLITDFKAKDMFFKMFVTRLRYELIQNLQNMTNLISGLSLFSNDLLVLTSVGLMEFKATETYLFAVDILPCTYKGKYEEDHRSVLDVIKQVDDLEINCLMYEKFVNTDFVRREFLQL